MKTKTRPISKQKKDPQESDSPIIDLNNAEIKALLKKGKTTGYITHEQLNKALPDGELTSEQIEDVMVAINELGINIIDQNEETVTDENDDKSSGNIGVTKVVVLMTQSECTLKRWALWNFCLVKVKLQ